MSSPASLIEEEARAMEDEMDAAEEALQPAVDAYYASLTSDLLGDGFHDTRLSSFHEGTNLPHERVFYSTPRHSDELKRVVETPSDHPLRAIAWVLNDAPPDSKIRVFCYSLTDALAIDLLIHAGSHCQVQIILHPHGSSTTRKNYTREAIDKFVDLHGKMTFLENMEIRLANLTGSNASNSFVTMHDKSIITTTYTTFGSYNLTNQARAGNWESLYVAPTSEKSISFFDNIWNSIPTRQIERFYTELDYSPMGNKRAQRRNTREAQAQAAGRRAADRQQQENQPQGHDT